jgi:AraC-like DNA-binding protein
MRSILIIPEGRDGYCFLHSASGMERRCVHSHDELEINLALSGQGTYLVDGHPVSMRPGTLLWLSPEQAHLLADESPDFSMWVAVIRSGRMPQERLSGCRCLSPDDADFFNALSSNLAAAEDEELLNAGLLYLFRQSAERLAQQDPMSAAHPSVTRAARFLKQSNGATDVEAVARQAGMSRSQLSRLFKKQTGYTLVEYRQKMQLERFLFLYGSGRQRNLLEAALDAGFGSYPQFYRVFLQRFGSSPREYFRE